MANMGTDKTTTIKLQKETKKRLDNLKVFRRETYDEILQKMLSILNLCRANPLKAKSRLISIDRQRRMSMQKISKQPKQIRMMSKQQL